jgi:hypothetical protein
LTNNMHAPDDLGGAGVFSQPPDDQGSFISALAVRLQRRWPGTIAIAQGADNAGDPETIVLIFEALTGRPATAVERLKLLTQIEARQRPPW